MQGNGVLKITNAEFMFTLIGSVVGAGILSLPNSIVATAAQDGWISTIIGAVYPFYIVLIGIFIIKKYPDKSITEVYVIHTGKVVGSIISLIFILQFPIYVAGVISSAVNLLRVYAVWFMKPMDITLVLVLLVVYASTKGINTLAKINTIVFFIIIVLTASGIATIRNASILNIQPVFGAGMNKILKASLDSVFAYAGMEMLLVFHPYVREKRNTIKIAFLSAFIITIIYGWTVFSSIFFLGPEIVPKAMWPYFFVVEGIRVPAITSFRFLFSALWIIVIFKSATNLYYGTVEMIHKIFTKVNHTKIALVLSPSIFLIPLFFQNELARRAFWGKFMPWSTSFNLIYITFIAVFCMVAKTRKDNQRGNVR